MKGAVSPLFGKERPSRPLFESEASAIGAGYPCELEALEQLGHTHIEPRTWRGPHSLAEWKGCAGNCGAYFIQPEKNKGRNLLENSAGSNFRQPPVNAALGCGRAVVQLTSPKPGQQPCHTIRIAGNGA